MSRPREFDPDTVRERIADVFTAHGYRGTSLTMLSEAAGLGKQSLYNAFGDKQSLYLHALACTDARMGAARQAVAEAASGQAAIEAFFGGLLAACTHPDPSVNTCIVSAGLLEGIEESAVSSSLREKWFATESLLRSAIERGQHDGSVRSDLAADRLACWLMTLMSGLRVTARAVASREQIEMTMRLGLQTLWPPS